MSRWLVLAAVVFGCRDPSPAPQRNSDPRQCTQTVEELQRFARDLAAVAQDAAGLEMRRLAEVPSGQRMPKGMVVMITFEVTVRGRMITTPVQWSNAKTAAVETALREALVSETASGSPAPPVLVLASHDAEWRVVAGVLQAAARVGLVPHVVFRAPLGVAEPRTSWVTEKVDGAADQIYDLLPAILKYERLAPDDEPSTFTEIQRGFRDAWRLCPLPSSPELAYKAPGGWNDSWPAWERWLTESVPAAILACGCNVDRAVAEGFIWSLLGAPRFKIVSRALHIDPEPGDDALTIAAAATAPWRSVATKLPARAEQPVRLVVQ